MSATFVLTTLLLLVPGVVHGASLTRPGGLQLVSSDVRRQLLTRAVQDVEDAVIKTFTYLIELDIGTK
jgi:hypothetical protein